MFTNKNSRIPLYAQVEDILISRIASGVLPLGSQLPTEDDLIEEFEVSRTTIRKTIQSLIQQGLVEIRRGKGTFVAHPKITQELTELTGFVEDMQVLGRQATARVLSRQIVAANDVVARQLVLPEGTPVVQIHRIRLADAIPISFDETYLPQELGEKIMAENLTTEPIFSLLEQKYNTPLVEAKYQLEAIAADTVVAATLGVEVGSPIFLIERTSYTEGNRPVDYEKLHYRGDQIRFVTQLARRTAKKPQVSDV
ncbi:GntR family transcriptional regulator [Ktedonobacter racemifer]|uniref:Transcriptional regulator, GntR family n=1 Tax=Ktedonobacter racemifer DSM 44963 TaxID=485913 RepID=D6TVI8_KTERA|nr:GntR family transcriptional regulator [Ktedonobacter racemifer]EFH85391.1 transcriptional regulator, GntR family [Ktedonobacter racemifer DSM 44963]